jgi:hypothetical protein
MSCFNNNNFCYLPQPPRAWSRVQNSCSVITDTDNNGLVRDPYTGQLVPSVVLAERIAMLNKGNVLQYKSNSSSLTKAQRYSKIAKGQWVNRNTTWATQSTRGYTNPNTTSLKRDGNINIAIDPITGAIIGPTESPPTCLNPVIPTNEGLPSNGGGGSSIDEPDLPPPVPPTPGSDVFPVIIPDTPVEPIVIQDGGNLICSIQENICTGEIKSTIGQQLCHPTTDSDVPGQIQELCWNDGMQTWYPRSRYVMTNSANKWPVNYKEFTSAVKPSPAVITSISYNTCVITLNWTQDESCLPVSNFEIYINDIFVTSVNGNKFTYNIFVNPSIVTEYNYFIISKTNSNIFSDKSNIVSITVYPILPPTITTISEAPNEVTITWNSPIDSGNIEDFNIYKSIGGGPFLLLTSLPISTFPRSYKDTGLTNNITYSYYILSSNICQISTQSNISSSTPLDLYTVIGNPTIYTTNNYYYLTFINNGNISVNYGVNNFNVIAVGGGGGGGGSYAAGAPNSAAGAGGGGGGVGLLSSFVPFLNMPYIITVGSGGGGGNGKNSGSKGGDSSFKYNSINYLTAEGGYGGQGHNYGTTGGAGGDASSIISITSYNGGGGGDCYPNISQDGTAWSGSPIILPDSTSYSFSGGGGGGAQFISPIYKTGGYAGLNGNGGAKGPNNIDINGQSAISNGSGGGGSGDPDVQQNFNGGNGGSGIVIIYFSYP